VRAGLGIKAGDDLDISIEDGALVLRPRAEALVALQSLFRNVRGSLAKELSAERRREGAELDP
jgi:hypothetical protein